MDSPIIRIAAAWEKSGIPLGRFLDNALTLAGRGLRGISEQDLADACEKYIEWRESQVGFVARYGMSKEKFIDLARTGRTSCAAPNQANIRPENGHGAADEFGGKDFE